MTMPIVAFFLGSIPFGLFISKFYGIKNLKSQGSGNIGATNVSRVVGFWPAGFLTFILDTAKGALPIIFLKNYGHQLLSTEPTLFELWMLGLSAVLGHCFSPWLGFKGGKGVATGLGAVAILSPIAAITGVIAFIVTFFSCRIGSLSSLTGLTVVVITHWVLYPPENYFFPGAAMIFVILMRHETNIDALLSGQEKKL